MNSRHSAMVFSAAAFMVILCTGRNAWSNEPPVADAGLPRYAAADIRFRRHFLVGSTGSSPSSGMGASSLIRCIACATWTSDTSISHSRKAHVKLSP
jgi:hypothetical protein